MPQRGAKESPLEIARKMTAGAVLRATATVIGEHTVKEGETLTHISLKYYGEEGKPFWKYLYEFNKNVIGPDMKLMKPGMKLKIPELTPELQAMKKKK